MADRPASRTLTFLFTDIEGSTRLLGALGDAYSDVRSDHLRLIRAAVSERGGEELGTEGDAVFAHFPEPGDAVAAAVNAQLALVAHSWPDGHDLRVRMGLHTGRVTVTADGYVGMALHETARVCAAGHGGQILLTPLTATLAGEGADFTTVDLGEHVLKDFPEPIRLYQVAYPGLASEFPPLRTSRARAGDLPVLLTTFVGREKELLEVGRLLEAHRCVTLTGAGGSGKTRLAIEAASAAEVADGAWFVDLAVVQEPDLVAETISAVLGVRAEGGLDIARALLVYLAKREVLLVLDNCEHLIDECAAVGRKLLEAGPGVRVLATSREPLEIVSEVVWPVPTLESGVAEELFRARAELASPGFSPTAGDDACIREICRRLDGVPLAIELAAARVGTLELSEIAARLDDSLRLLSGGRRADLPRQQTLRATIDWSYDLLAEDERRLFERLSVFDGNFALESAEAVGACDSVAARDVVDVFTRLVAKSLVVKEQSALGTGRYRLLDTLRQYGGERLEARGARAEVEQAHATYWRTWLRAGKHRLFLPGSGDWHRRVDAELPNLRAAMAWSLAHEPDHAALVDAVAVCGWTWFVRGKCDETRSWISAAVEQTRSERTTRRAEVLYVAGLCAMSDADMPAAVAAALECADVGREVGDFHLLSRGLEIASIGNWAQGDFQLADELISESCALTEEDAPWDFAAAHPHWARVRKSLGDLEGAQRIAALGVSRAERIGESHVLGWALDVAADVALAGADLAAAAANAERSLAHYREVGYEEGVASALNRMGDIALERAAWAEAEDAYAQAAVLAERIGHRGGRVWALEGFARAVEAQGDSARAADALSSARTLRDEAGLRRLAVDADHIGRLEERLRSQGYSL